MAAAWGGRLRRTAQTAPFRRSASRLSYRDDSVRKKHMDGDERKQEGRERPARQRSQADQGRGRRSEEAAGGGNKGHQGGKWGLEWEDATAVVAGGAKEEEEAAERRRRLWCGLTRWTERTREGRKSPRQTMPSTGRTPLDEAERQSCGCHCRCHHCSFCCCTSSWCPLSRSQGGSSGPLQKQPCLD